MKLWSVVAGVSISFAVFALFIYVLYRLVVWARRRATSAYVVAAALAPFFAMGNVSDPDFQMVEEAKQLKKREEDDSGDPPNEADSTAEICSYASARDSLADQWAIALPMQRARRAKTKRRVVAMSREKRRRPILVWAISVVVGVVALSQLVIQLLPLLLGPSSTVMAVLRDAVVSTQTFDRASVFLLSAILLTSMVLFFRLRTSSVRWFTVYSVLGLVAVLRYAVEPKWAPTWFDLRASLIGITATALILAYMWWLKRRRMLA